MTETTILPILGLTLSSVIRAAYDDSILFGTTCGRTFEMLHTRDCCEYVHIEDISGSALADLVGSPIIQAECTTKEDDSYSDLAAWTFYRIGTANAQVVIRWHGSSNGFYSVRVDFIEIKNNV